MGVRLVPSRRAVEGLRDFCGARLRLSPGVGGDTSCMKAGRESRRIFWRLTPEAATVYPRLAATMKLGRAMRSEATNLIFPLAALLRLVLLLLLILWSLSGHLAGCGGWCVVGKRSSTGSIRFRRESCIRRRSGTSMVDHGFRTHPEASPSETAAPAGQTCLALTRSWTKATSLPTT